MPGQAFVVSASGGRLVPIGIAGRRRPPLARARTASCSIGSRRTSSAARHYVADVATGTARLLREDVDEKFWSIPGNAGAAAQASPDGKWIAFLSDRDGWDHLYVMTAGGGAAGAGDERGVRSLATGRGRPTARASPSTRNEPKASPASATSASPPSARASPPATVAMTSPRAAAPTCARLVARRHAPRLPAHRPAELRGPVRRSAAAGARAGRGSPTRCRPASTARRSSSPSW